jgi:hypothetical protein
MLRTLKALVYPILAYYPQILSATATSSSVDLQDYGSAMITLMVGTFTFATANKLTPLLLESDDGTTFGTVAAADYLEGVLPAALAGTADSQTIRQYNYRGAKRYIELQLTMTGTVSVACAIEVIKGHPQFQPGIS